MNLHLDNLLNLANVTVFTCYKKEDFYLLELECLNEKVKCNYCDFLTDNIHQDRTILVKDLSICGNNVYLKIPRRQIYCQMCKKYSTEKFDFIESGRKSTIRYEQYIYERVKELTVEQVSYQENLSTEQVQNIFNRLAEKKKTGDNRQD